MERLVQTPFLIHAVVVLRVCPTPTLEPFLLPETPGGRTDLGATSTWVIGIGTTEVGVNSVS